MLHNSGPQVCLSEYVSRAVKAVSMEWGIIALGGSFAVYLLYCFVKDWRALRRFNRIRRKSRDTAAVKHEHEGK